MESKSNAVNVKNNQPIFGMVERFFVVSNEASSQDAVSVTSTLLENAYTACSVLTSDYDMRDDEKFSFSDRVIRDALFGIEQTLELAVKSANFAVDKFPRTPKVKLNSGFERLASGMVCSLHAAAEEFSQVRTLIQQAINNLQGEGKQNISPAILDLLIVASKICNSNEEDHHRYADRCQSELHGIEQKGGRDE